MYASAMNVLHLVATITQYTAVVMLNSRELGNIPVDVLPSCLIAL